MAASIESRITCVYELYGYKLSHVPRDTGNIGSILVEGSWNSHEYNIPQYGSSVKMMLQVILGHDNSTMYPLFQDLVILQRCLNALADKKGARESAVISCEPFNTDSLSKSIVEIIHEANAIRIIPDDDVLQNIKETSLTDKLWNVLKGCEKVSDLTHCFNLLFETISSESLRLQISEDDKNTMVGKMIHDVYTGKIIIPYLSSKQSLELLIELGMQKMKRTYVFLIKSYDFSVGEKLLRSYNNRTSLCEAKRGTFAEMNLTQGFEHLHLLLHTHLLLEFLHLVEEKCCFCRDVSLMVLKHACDKYIIENVWDQSFLIWDMKQLYDLVVPLNATEMKLMQDCNPVKWQIKMTSSLRDSSVITMFHYSNKPVFPEVIYKYEQADVSHDVLHEKYFVTQLESYGDKIC